MIIAWWAITAMLLILGIYLSVLALCPAQVNLADALACSLMSCKKENKDRLVNLVTENSGFLERLGAGIYVKGHFLLSKKQVQSLALQGRSIGDFFTEKIIWFFLGLITPMLIVLIDLIVGRLPSVIPVIVSLILALVGFFIPDHRLSRYDKKLRDAATEAILTFFDLVVLERMANRSAVQSLRTAASVSDEIVFLRIRAALDRAQLEQVTPWQQLHLLSKDLAIPEISELVDVLRLDDQGASLASPLMDRVRDLRDTYLNQLKRQAQEKSEHMTIWMTLPAIVTGLIFLFAPLLRISGL